MTLGSPLEVVALTPALPIKAPLPFSSNAAIHRTRRIRNPNPPLLQQRTLAAPFTMTSEVACTYACLILHDDGIPITAEKISAILKAAGVTVESYWPGLFAKLCEKRNVEDLILNVGAGGGGAAAAVAAPVAGGAAPAAAAAPAAEEKKEEPKEESDDDMGFSLFD